MQRTPSKVNVREHSHAETWADTMDWPELLDHLVQVHGESRDELEILKAHVEGTFGRRKSAENRHRSLHQGMPE